ncbi:sugar phosphate isomerase/epimerase family protein [Leifsonia poae]|uniref:sugar phosphate isomerase/epimerase family protein n=1 Tax=Leifsonia poae TaxID=110933 RepID=UPI001CBC2D5E|nr:sugar phosphate isomerase/epimerase family protein [Leifsonia poae]
MTLRDVIDQAAAAGADHLELALPDESLLNDTTRVQEIANHAAERGVELANYLVGGNLLDDPDAEIDRLRRHLDTAHALGVPLFRHDVTPWAWRESDQREYERVFDAIVPACRAVADHAETLGMVSTVENHGYFLNGSDRIRSLIARVDRPNFGLTLDLGNTLCVGEAPEKAVAELIGAASIVHVKDFHIRRNRPGGAWLETRGGHYLLGTIAGHGDLDLERLLGIVRAADYDGRMSIEFEGLEECRTANTVGLENVRRIWEGS